MATADKTTKKVTLSATVGAKDTTIKSIKDAQSFLSAPDSATVSIGNTGPVYTDGQLDENADTAQFTSSWSEDR